LAGLIFTARSHAARPDIGAGLELNVIAAVILGGTSLFGGRGTILGTLLGCVIVGILDNGLILLGVTSSTQLVVKGVIIIAAVAFSRK
jgi:ribose/xylose/arabinose/galactoside ABC-type transport system permease subunit